MSDPHKPRSIAVSRGHQRAILKACGVSDAEMDRPFIGVIYSWSEIVPGHIHLRGIAEAVKSGILATGRIPFESNTIALCDAFSSGKNFKCFLPSSEIIADCIEVVVELTRFDGLVMISSCDKIELKEAPEGLPFEKMYDVKTLQPNAEHWALYDLGKAELQELCVPF